MSIIQYSMNTGNYGLEIIIETERTVMRLVTQQDIPLYQTLFADKNVMVKYADGRPRNTEEDRVNISNRVEGWVNRWSTLPDKQKTYDPYNAMSIFEKDTGKFIGFVVLGRSGKPGILEGATLNHEEFWRKGLGKEFTSAMHELLPILLQAEYKLDGEPVKKIIGTARKEHIASQKLMQNAGMVTDKKIEKKYNAKRYEFIGEVSLESLPPIKSNTSVLGLFKSKSIIGPTQTPGSRAVFIPK